MVRCMLIFIYMERNIHELIDINPPFPLTEISIALQEGFDIGSGLNRIHQLYQSRIILHPLPSILRQTLVMQDLIENEIRVGHALSDDVWSCFREVVGLEVSFQSL